jgi:glycosyltransferase involved in cell wall biosynthesis
VIATDTPAMRDTVTDGVNAVLVPARDPRALADAIHALDAAPARLSALAEGATRAARDMDTSAWAARVIREAAR